MLWMLRQYLYRAYRLSDDRLSAYASGLSKKNEVKIPTNKVPIRVNLVPLIHTLSLDTYFLSSRQSPTSNLHPPAAPQDVRVPFPQLHVLDLNAHLDTTLHRAKEQYKTAKYLLKEDARLCSVTSTG